MRAPVAGPAEVRVEVIRQGRRVSTVRAGLWQEGRPFVETLISAGAIAAGDPEWAGDPAPVLPPPADCPEWEPPNFPIPLFRRMELRLDPATHPWPGNGNPVIRGWIRVRDEAEPDPLLLLVAVDAMPPTVFHLGRFGWAPTVELTGLVRAVQAPGWLRCEARTKAVEGGWFDEEATVWDATGRLVAQSRQLALAAGS
jgi:acyl-CoA thioesterase